jgi:hypothetical protein
MSETPKAVTLDGLTGQVTERELNAEEIADNAQFQIEYEATIADREAAAKARTSALAKLKKLGLTDKEIAAL